MRILGDTRVCALIGDPVEHSLSPRIHNAAFQHLKLNYVYVAFRVTGEDLENALQGARALKIHGLNVTMPLKTRIVSYMDRLDPSAERIGAVNTVLNEEGRLIGHNTDGLGALTALRAHGQDPTNKKVLILGAGGASRAVSYALSGDAREIVILNRTVWKARALANELNKAFGKRVRHGRLDEKELEKELEDVDILINATPLGMHPNENETPVSRRLLRSDLTVFDLVYNPPETRLLREAREIGAKTINGLAMLVHQGALSFEIWTGRRAPIDVMLKACTKGLKAEEGAR